MVIDLKLQLLRIRDVSMETALICQRKHGAAAANIRGAGEKNMKINASVRMAFCFQRRWTTLCSPALKIPEVYYCPVWDASHV
jgi:hypothetical protein